MEQQVVALPIYRHGSATVEQDFPVALIDEEGAWVTLETALMWELAHRRLADSIHASSRVSRRRRTLFAGTGTASTAVPVGLVVSTNASEQRRMLAI